jgi:hypothetical protein
VHEAFRLRGVGDGEDHEVGLGQEGVQVLGARQLEDAGRGLATAGIDADHPHAEGVREPGGLASDAAHPHHQRGGLGQVHHPGVDRRRLPLAPELQRQVVVQPAREREHEGHDVGADVVVVDLAEVGDHHRVRDQLAMVVAGGWGRLRSLQPAEARGLAEQRGRQRAEGGVRGGDLARGLRLVLRHHHRERGERGRDPGGPRAGGGGLRRQHQEGGHGPRAYQGRRPGGSAVLLGAEIPGALGSSQERSTWRAGAASSAG